MTYYGRTAALDSDDYPVTKEVDRILNKRTSITPTYSRNATPEPRSIMRNTGAALMDSRISNVRDRIDEELKNSPPPRRTMANHRTSLTPTRTRYQAPEPLGYNTFSPQKETYSPQKTY